MRKAINIVVMLFWFIFSTTAYGSEAIIEPPHEMVQKAATQTFSRIKMQRSEIEDNPLILEEIVTQELLPHIDYKFSAFKVLGKYFRDYSKEEIAEYIDVFKDYSVAIFANALRYYKNQDVIFEPAGKYDKTKSVTVRVQIIESGNIIHLAFQVRKNKQQNKWLVYDISAEGVSMVSSLQSQFAPILRKEGLHAVIKTMSNKNVTASRTTQ